MRTSWLLGALLAASLSAPAEAYLAGNGLRVEALGATSFRVPFGGAGGASAFWCAAGEYAQRRLGLGVTDRIWRATPVPRKSGEPMAFSTQASASAGDTGLIILYGRNDGSLSVAAALNTCRPPR